MFGAVATAFVTLYINAQESFDAWTMAEYLVAPNAVACSAVPVATGVIVKGTLSRATDCVTTISTSAGPLQIVADYYSVDVPAGGALRATLDAPEVDDYFGLPYIVFVDPEGNPFLAKVGTTNGPTGRRRADLEYAVPRAGNWKLLVTGIGSSLSTPAGTYDLTVTVNGAPTSTCTPTATDVCLLGNRFRVSVAYVNRFANPPQPGNFIGAKLVAGSQNPDVATFGISSAQAIEVVVRIQDTRPFALNRFDVYYGGLTDLEYTITITDTLKNVTKPYSNDPGRVGGGVDRVTFVAN